MCKVALFVSCCLLVIAAAFLVACMAATHGGWFVVYDGAGNEAHFGWRGLCLLYVRTGITQCALYKSGTSIVFF